jgi:hypothetical protein
MKTDENVPSKSNKHKNLEKNLFLLACQPLPKNSRIRIRKSVVRIRGSGKMSRIHNSGYNTRERPDLVCNPTRDRIPLHRVADHDILVWIRIRGFMPLTHGSGSESFYFRHQTSRRQTYNF